MGYLDVHNSSNIVLLTPGNEGQPVILNPTNYNLTMSGASATLTGSSGHVMKQIPKFYYSYSYSGSVHTYKISLSPFPGSQLHPWFIKAGAYVDYRYIAVYPAAWYDVSAGAYVDGDGTNSAFDAAADKLGSIVGKKPLSNITRAKFRSAAARVGSGWSITDFWGYAALKLLYITKYGSLNSQSKLGSGNSQFASWAFSSCISATGKVLSVTATGQSTSGGNSGDYSNFDGLEDAFGGLWEFVDGWNISNGANYACSNPSNYADDTTTNYGLYGSTNPTSSGWQDTLQQNIGLLPAGVGNSASSVTKVTDYYWYSGGWVAPFVGGYAAYGAYAGLFCLYANYSSADAVSHIGARLCY